MAHSINQNLRPIPLAATNIRNPNGRVEVSEPNFTLTKPCRSCSPIAEIPATGWVDSHTTQPQGITEKTTQSTVSLSAIRVIVIQVTVEFIVVGHFISITSSQVVTINDTSYTVRSLTGTTQVFMPTKTISLGLEIVQSHSESQITNAPHPSSLSTGTGMYDGTSSSNTSADNSVSSLSYSTRTLSFTGGVQRRLHTVEKELLCARLSLIWCVLWLMVIRM